jgi:hypothetical protein
MRLFVLRSAMASVPGFFRIGGMFNAGPLINLFILSTFVSAVAAQDGEVTGKLLVLRAAAVSSGPAAAPGGGVARPAVEGKPEPEPIVSDRPGYSLGAAILLPGMFQFEGGYSFTKADSARRHALGETLLRFSPGSRLELHLGLNSYMLDRLGNERSGGMDDFSFGAKIPVLQASGKPSLLHPTVSLDFRVTAPTGSHGVSDELVQPESRAILEWPLPRGWMIRTNLGHAWAGQGGSGFHQLGGSVQAAWAPNPKTSWFVEYYSFQPEAIRGRMSKFVDAGFGWVPNRNLQIDAWCGFGGHFDQLQFLAGLGISHRWRFVGR